MSSDYYGSIAGEIADRERQRLAQVSRCQMCGRSATGAEWDLLNHAQAMNFTLGAIRTVAEAGARSGADPVESILRLLSEPYRFPLPIAEPNAEAGQ